MGLLRNKQKSKNTFPDPSSGSNEGTSGSESGDSASQEKERLNSGSKKSMKYSVSSISTSTDCDSEYSGSDYESSSVYASSSGSGSEGSGYDDESESDSQYTTNSESELSEYYSSYDEYSYGDHNTYTDSSYGEESESDKPVRKSTRAIKKAKLLKRNSTLDDESDINMDAKINPNEIIGESNGLKSAKIGQVRLERPLVKRSNKRVPPVRMNITSADAPSKKPQANLRAAPKSNEPVIFLNQEKSTERIGFTGEKKSTETVKNEILEKRNKTDMIKTPITGIESARWFFGRISGREAEKILNFNSFLVRERPHTHEYYISFKTSRIVKHFPIDVLNDGILFGNTLVPDIHDYVRLFSRTPIPDEKNKPVYLDIMFNRDYNRH